ncbi:MAG: UxaA family hydrolase [Tissierellia bacterium]|nr:UxaA family hydrolase [Tissierellia bacterium]
MRKFKGYLREDGSVGIRNHILVLPMVICANSVVEAIGREYPDIITIPHVYGCTFDPISNEEITDVFIGLGNNPNVASVLLVSLGCETINLDEVYEGIKGSGKPVEKVIIQDCGGTVKAIEKSRKIVENFKELAKDTKVVEAPLSDLIVGTECGASDSYSGLSANPVVGYVCDKFVDQGATAILTEVTEFVGAEDILAEQCANEEVAKELLDMVKETEGNLARVGHSDIVDISPGNIAGGLTTIEEKSLGCIKKGGNSPIQEVLKHGERPTKKGLVAMDAPGHDVESMTAMAAGGAHLIYFTTGRGTPTGFPIVPVIKVSSNTETYMNMNDNIDINTGEVIEGKKSIAQVGEELFDYTLKVVDGEETKSEKLGCREFAIRRRGVDVCIL